MPRQIGVIGARFDGVGISAQARSDQLRRLFGGPAHHGLQDGGDVDGMGDGLTDADVLERIALTARDQALGIMRKAQHDDPRLDPTDHIDTV